MTATTTETLTVTIRKGSVFIWRGGNCIADSITIRRQRGFHNALTDQYVAAPDMTPRKVRQGPARVLAYLEMTGTDVDGLTVKVA